MAAQLHGDAVWLKTLRTTWFGPVHIDAISLAQDCIFAGDVKVRRSQMGGMRFCYVPDGPHTPRRYYCQPDLSQRIVQRCEEIVATNRPCDAVAYSADGSGSEIIPRWTSSRFGDPGYAQLALSCPDEIRRGTEDESEMGVFHDLYQSQRTDNLQTRLDAFQPASMRAAIFFET